MTRSQTFVTPRKRDVDLLLAGEHYDPHGTLGAHPLDVDGRTVTVVRAYQPEAAECNCLPADGPAFGLEPIAPGLFAGSVEGSLGHYRLEFRFANGLVYERDDPYRFSPSLGELDLHLFNEGTHRHLWRCLGARPSTIDSIAGVAFSVWAPNARRVSVVGDFCNWDGRVFPMRSLGASGIFEIFIPDITSGTRYKYEIKTQDGSLNLKADPLASASEHPPGTSSMVFESEFRWSDSEWIGRRTNGVPAREPMTVYEVHLESWARVPEQDHRPLSYREITPRLIEHAKRFGFTHLELLPVAEHPFSGSWGYQVSGYYAPTARFGSPDDFRYLVDQCHQAGIGIVLDWVPAHFPKDDFALRRFDGTALYEHEDRRRAEHPDWGTLIFNYGRSEVRSFLIANAVYWFEEFHVDGLRVDAVASMLYLDYSREDGEWIPNEFGGRENLDAVGFLKELNDAVRSECPGCITVAEESTAWPGVTRPTHEGGLGFTFKWNMGWMHDTLAFFAKDPVHRKHHYDQFTFAMLYEYSERFIMPLSHDEVVHGKGSLLGKMPGDEWQKLASLRSLLTYQYTRPGKQLLFMGTEFAPDGEWNHDSSLDWHLADVPSRAEFGQFLSDLGRLYRKQSCLWRLDESPEGFSWIDCNDRENSVISYQRRDGADHLLVVLNLTPVPREGYRLGAPMPGTYREALSSDAARYGGSQFETLSEVNTDPVPFHGQQQSLLLRLPPLGALVLEPVP